MNSRRDFLKQLSVLMLTPYSDLNLSDTDNNPTTTLFNRKNKLGVALVGLGRYSEGELAPALLNTNHCYLAGIVTGTPEKAGRWQKKYAIPDANIYDYNSFDSIKDNKEIQVVYVVLPNALHKEFVIRAAKAGKHVICEKPMGISVEECEEMIAACAKADRMLSIGYRLHFEPYNLEMMRLGNSKVFGSITQLKAANGMHVSHSSWRTDKQLSGGGPLMDLGIYCVQGSLYTKGMLPVAVTAIEADKTNKELFSSVEEAISWELQFADGVKALGNTSYVTPMSQLRAEAEKGWFELSPAYSYSGIQGRTSKGVMNFPQVNQQALQLDDFAKCIINKRKSKVPGEMGLRDVKILMAIYEAASIGKSVKLNL